MASKKPSDDQSLIFDPDAVDAGDRPIKSKSRKKKPAALDGDESWFAACRRGEHQCCPYHVFVQHKAPPRWETCACPCGHPGRTTSHDWIL